MQQIINFIVRNRIFLLYLLLLTISLVFTVQSHSFHRSKFFNSSNWVSGSIYNASAKIRSYFNLREENQELLEENLQLKQLLFGRNVQDTVVAEGDSIPYRVVTARVIKNSFASPDNYLTINKGRKDSIEQDMGVVTSKGILGIVERTSNRFATVQSILNSNSNINAKIANTNYFGSLVWNGEAYNVVQLEDIPRLVPLLVGDTIVTGAMSSIFPENIPIGVIKQFNLKESETFYTIDVELFNDMANLNNVYVILDTRKEEIRELEQTTTNEQQ